MPRDNEYLGAVDLLHLSTLDSELLSNTALREDLVWIQGWWELACRAQNQEAHPPVFGGQRDAAHARCITFAQEIIKAERCHRNRQSLPETFAIRRDIAREFFNSLKE